MQFCAITDRRHASVPLLQLVQDWSDGGVHYLQLREKDLTPPQLDALAREAGARLDRTRSKLLINIASPVGTEVPTTAWAEVALAAGADGVHLAGKLLPGAASSVRQTFRSGGREAIISVPCHSVEEVYTAYQEQVDLILFSPVFEKISEKIPASVVHGLSGLRRACAAAQAIPVFALGGITSSNALDCVAAGAAGVAGIRLFATGDWRRLGTPS